MSRNEFNDQQWQLLVLLLRKIAEQKGISQNKIAELTGLKQSNISRMFALKFPPSMRVFLKVASAIDVNFYFEDRAGQTDLNKAFEAAMSELGRRPDKLPQN